MAISSLTYAPPVRRDARPPRPDYELLEAAGAFADEGKPLEAVMKVFQHLFPSQAIPDLAKNPFSFVQGSSRVTAKIEGDDLAITVPLVRLPTGGSAIAALRFVLTKLSANGQLYQPRLRGEDLYLEYRDKVSRLHPAKLLEVLRRMPFAADRNDDWLIGQFSALPLERAAIDPPTDDEAARCEAIWRAHWNDVEELVTESQRKRSMFFLNEVTAYAFYKIKFAIPLSGFLGARLSEAAGTFNNSQEDPDKRTAALAKCAKEMRAVSDEELRKNVGHVVYALNPLSEGKASILSGYFAGGDYIEAIEEARTSGRPFDAALALICTYTYLLAQFTWPEVVENELEAGLALASGKPWREAANLLYEHAQRLVAKFGEDAESGDGDDPDDDAGTATGGQG